MFHSSTILPRFVVLESLDGAGTTTQLALLNDHLEKQQIAHWVTHEPTDGNIGRLIRQVLSGDVVVTADVLARLYAADRSQHIEGANGVLEHLAENQLVICDRYVFSSLAYQGSEIPEKRVWEYNCHFPLPELVLFLDIPPEAGEKRYANRKTSDIYEKIDFQRKVRERYEQLFQHVKSSQVRFERVDSSQSIEKVFQDIWSILESLPIVKG